MIRTPRKRDFPVSQVRRYLEPGPIVLVSSRCGDETNTMKMGWHTVMEFTPSLVGCVISSGNHSFRLVRESGECVINLTTTALTDAVVRIGNATGAEIDKFPEFGPDGRARARGEGAIAKAPGNAALHRRRRVHGLRQDHQPPVAVSARDVVK